MKKVIIVLFLSIMICSNSFAQTFTAKTNRSEVPAGELFVLSLLYQGQQSNDEPDLSVLDKGFSIYSASSTSETQIVNGEVNTTKQWEISLISDKTEGEINIPSIKMGDLSSNSLKIKINNNPAPESSSVLGYENVNSNQPKYSIKTVTDNDNPFVQQQINYSIIIQDNGGLQISEPTFNNNVKDNWIIKHLGTPNVNNKNLDGKTVREITFNYALFPQKSGTLTLPEAKIDGYYITQEKNSRAKNITGDFFNDIFQDELGNLGRVFSDVFAQRNPVVLKTNPASIEVKPNIQNLGWWLPAKNVELVASWKSPPSQFKVGEAISRTIEIKAVGVLDSQLPNIEMASIDGMKQYPEKPILYSRTEGNDVVSFAEISNIYIPSKTGNITIPQIELHWFNITTNKLEKAVIAPTTINIFPNENYVAEENIENNNENIENNNEVKGKTDEEEKEAETNFIENKILSATSTINDYILTFIAFVTGVFISYLLFKPKKTKENNNKRFKIDYKKNVITSSELGDFTALRSSLIHWASERFKDNKLNNLSDLNKYIKNKEFAKYLEIISAKLFSDKSDIPWDSNEFAKAFEKLNNDRVIISDNSTILPKLYKE